MNHWRGDEASNLKVYLKETEIWAVTGEGHESFDRDANVDFAAWGIA